MIEIEVGLYKPESEEECRDMNCSECVLSKKISDTQWKCTDPDSQFEGMRNTVQNR